MYLVLRHRILVAALATVSLTGCSIAKQIFTPEQDRLEESSARQRAEVAQYPDGECSSAESCKDRCEVLERALDCYKTGKAALGGVDAHYAGGWRTEAVAGSTDDITVHYEHESEEHISLMPLARESFERACTAGHAESCRISGNLIRKDRPEAAAELYRKACELHDETACAKAPGTK
jgi:TPR repeat protein